MTMDEWYKRYDLAKLNVDENGKQIKPWSRPRKFKSDTDMYYKILDYFKANYETRHLQTDKKGLQVITKEPMTIHDLTTFLGFSGSGSILPYKRGEYDENGDNFSSLLAWAWECVENDQNKGSMMNIYNDRAVIASLQHKHKWTLKQHITIDEHHYMTSDELNKQLLGTLNQLADYIGLDAIDVDSQEL